MSRKLPPLNAVRVFAVAARLGSFTRAADELAVTHSAVSKQIAGLEDFIGARLFERASGGVALTDEGSRLRDAIAAPMQQLDQAFERFSRKPIGSQVLRVATVASFAAHVFIRHLPALKAALPDLEIDLTTSDRALDIGREAIDVAIRFGDGKADGLASRALVKGELVAVASDDKAQALETIPRIQAFENNEWSDVSLAELRNDLPVFRAEHFVVAIEAALAGHGIALLPRILVQRFIDDGQLLRLPIEPVAWPATFHLIHDPRSRNLAQIERFGTALTACIEP